MIRLLAILGVTAVLLGACDSKPPAAVNTATEQRTDYTPEEFGIGRRHTPDSACNRDIDALLDGIRLCYKSDGISDKCERLQQKNNAAIKRLRHSIRCVR